ncbi:MAG TPA: hypothetical protein VGD43_09020 [Micromonospora sp.]
MSDYGPPGQGRPEDPFHPPASPAGGYPPPGGGYPPPGGTYPPPGGSYPPPGDSYPPPGGTYPPPGDSYPPPGGSYPPPGGQPPGAAGYPPATEQWGPAPGSGMGPAFPPVAPPKKSKAGKIVLIVLLVLVLVCGCIGGAGYWLYDWGKEKVDALPSTFPTAPLTPGASDSAEPSASPSAEASDDPTVFNEGDCVVNEGTDSDAELKKVPCGPGTYEVLSRIPFTADGKKCETDPIFGDKDADANYTHDDTRDYLDYVLCLKKR